jgi:hypothetical protein
VNDEEEAVEMYKWIIDSEGEGKKMGKAARALRNAFPGPWCQKGLLRSTTDHWQRNTGARKQKEPRNSRPSCQEL